jgi:hypothetical protein
VGSPFVWKIHYRGRAAILEGAAARGEPDLARRIDDIHRHAVRGTPPSSWPGSSRPSTTSLWRRRELVDARPKAGHDGKEA